MVKPVAMSSMQHTSCSAAASSSLESYTGRSSLCCGMCGDVSCGAYIHAGYFSNQRPPLSSLVEAGMGARVKDEGAGHALDVEAAEDAVVAL